MSAEQVLKWKLLPPLHDVGDDNHVVESGGVVHDSSNPQPKTSSTG